MKLKIDEKGNAVLQDGHPVYVHPDGTEAAFDAKAAHTKIGTLTREAAEKRTALKEATDKLAAFSGIEDPAEALKALQFAAAMDGKKVMDDDGIQKLIQAAVKPLQEKLTASEAALSEKDGHIYKLEVSNKFQASPFVKDKLIIPPDMLEATFGKHFKVENGKLVATDSTGSQIFSKIKAGEPADFDEAIQSLVDAHPMKDTLYKASGASGSGSQQSNAANKQEVKTIARSVFETYTPAQQSQFSIAGGTVTD